MLGENVKKMILRIMNTKMFALISLQGRENRPCGDDIFCRADTHTRDTGSQKAITTK